VGASKSLAFRMPGAFNQQIAVVFSGGGVFCDALMRIFASIY